MNKQDLKLFKFVYPAINHEESHYISARFQKSVSKLPSYANQNWYYRIYSLIEKKWCQNHECFAWIPKKMLRRGKGLPSWNMKAFHA